MEGKAKGKEFRVFFLWRIRNWMVKLGEKSMDILDKVSEIIAGAGRNLSDKAKKAKEIASLKSQVRTCENIIEKNFLEIGKLYFEKYGECPDPDFEKACRSIKNAKHGVRELNKKINEQKKGR